ncbi:hypothetical protein [Evansella tamaricis]|uniref:Uncharacterized protein n=1 Tax=Evansella tamaricis TaxID=2069301 RepID=A0ABS6JG16_9BACI|nr:hypothetical protein [Evansella tamaricis]MBU9712609.1 hypothetical protein [Evansella tamaricis]
MSLLKNLEKRDIIMSEQAVEQTHVGTTSTGDQREEVVPVTGWLLYMLVMMIPLVNIVMLFVWAFGSNVNKNKSNLAKASLIWMVIGIILSIVFSVMMGAVISSIFGEFAV